MNLFRRQLLAFVVVIVVAVVTVALLAGYSTAVEFRRYAALYSGRTQRVASAVVDYYSQRGSWSGLQAALPALAAGGGRGRQEGIDSAHQGIGYLVADVDRMIVATSSDAAQGRLSPADADAALPLLLGDTLIGYLAPAGGEGVALDERAQAFLTQLRWALLVGAGVASLVGLVLAALFTRSIVSPVQTLTRTAETISEGRFDVRARVEGDDEIARLGATFNSMAASLEHAERVRRSQTADIAHELRNPLAVLQSTLEALADGVYEPTNEHIEPALDQVRVLSQLIEDLRTLALADAGKLSLELQVMDLNVLVARVVDGYRERFRASDVSLQMNLGKELPPAGVDYLRLSQVVNNILANAVRYVPAQGHVQVLSLMEDGGVVVEVLDDGPGVPADQLVHLFDRFWRGEPSRSRDTGGSGLGLAIARQIVEAHGGRIWATPTSGGGLTVGFWLPPA